MKTCDFLNFKQDLLPEHFLLHFRRKTKNTSSLLKKRMTLQFILLRKISLLSFLTDSITTGKGRTPDVVQCMAIILKCFGVSIQFHYLESLVMSFALLRLNKELTRRGYCIILQRPMRGLDVSSPISRSYYCM